MESQLSYDVVIHLKLTDEEFNFINEAILNNRETKRYAEQGEFWYGLTGRRNYASSVKEECWLDFTGRQLDIVLLKSLEKYVTYVLPDKDNQQFGADLFNKILNILKDAGEKSKEINKNFI